MMSCPYDVIIPAWNSQDTIIETLVAISNQTVKPAKVIVIDDGSTDKTAEVALASGLATTLISITNGGVGAATTRGFAELEADVTAFCDADDIWFPDKIEKQLAVLLRHDGPDALCGDMTVFQDLPAGRTLGKTIQFWGRSVLVMKTQAIRQIGPVIDPPGGRGDMVDWISRGRDLGLRFECLSEALAYRRMRAGSLSFNKNPKQDIGYLHAVHAAILRKREKGQAT